MKIAKLFLFSIVLSNAMHAGICFSSYPYISGDTLRSICDYTMDDERAFFSGQDVKDGDIIYVKTDYLDAFFAKVMPYISKKFVLVSHNCDYGITGKYVPRLNDDRIIAWFSQNIEIVHPKLHPIPIGIANKRWVHGNTRVFDEVIGESFVSLDTPVFAKATPGTRDERGREEDLVSGELDKDIRSSRISPLGEVSRETNGHSTPIVYLNCAPQTCPERKVVYELFTPKDFCHLGERVPLREYLVEMSNYPFVLSPRGNGLDCHRTWEALLCGCIPVVRTSALDSLYDGLPVIIVNNWREVTPEFLEKHLQELSEKTFAREKLYAPYWIEKIQAAAVPYRKPAEHALSNKQYYATACDSNYFAWLMNLIGSIHKNDFEQLEQIAVFDLGLDEQQKQFLQRVAKVQVYPLEMTHQDLLTPFTTNSTGKTARGWYAWKAVAIKQALELFPYVLYLDAGVVVLKPLRDLFKYIQKRGYFLLQDQAWVLGDKIYHFTIRDHCNQFVMQTLKLDVPYNQWILFVPGITAGVQGVSRSYADRYVRPVYELTHDLRFFQDDGSARLGFGWGRHDQTIFSVRARLLGLDLIPAKEEVYLSCGDELVPFMFADNANGHIFYTCKGMIKFWDHVRLR